MLISSGTTVVTEKDARIEETFSALVGPSISLP